MKKLFIVAAILLGLVSCTDDDSKKTDPETVLLKSIEVTEVGYSYKAYYLYEGNKITRITYDDGSYESYTYTDNLLTKIEYIEGSTALEEIILTYNPSNRLATFQISDLDGTGWFEKTFYNYTSDNTITTNIYHGSDGNPAELDETGIITLVDGNIVSYSAIYTEGYSEVFNYTFDNKHSPTTNAFADNILNLTRLEGGINNITKYAITPDNDIVEEYETTFEYNAAGFPTKSIENEGDGDYMTVKYHY